MKLFGSKSKEEKYFLDFWTQIQNGEDFKELKRVDSDHFLVTFQDGGCQIREMTTPQSH